MYHGFVTGELEQASQAYELWAKTYPQDLVPPTNLGDIYAQLGQYEKAVTETQYGLRLEPTMVGYGNLAGDYLALNRLDDVNKTIEQARTSSRARRAGTPRPPPGRWPVPPGTRSGAGDRPRRPGSRGPGTGARPP